MLGKIFEEKLADYVAMDVKGPFNLYRRLTGVERVDERDDLLKGMSIVNKFPGYEYRTTMVPLADDAGIRWLSAEEIGETAKMIYDHTGVNEHIHYIQPFVARSRDEMLDERFCKENLLQEFHETPRNLLEEALKQAQKYLPDARLR
jgi:pyruvate-formate lyase-activating enzyme